ncbi:helix-turn-helix transcriptional regulator [Paludibacterium purpuratum]|uniref:Helix-turn-helix protein n=1 Tax=Paludibacterium purpuratum TaxID=1144873 RepID=A0A4R7B2P8_9NEIS|nr:helix-turn-helix transcriptional regulator [Paludibacterium purpuratum]TDR76434.1 helix-turn-helix protein [Paludibacterium purpuratum]
MVSEKESALGAYLKDRRARLDPEALGLPMSRRRTPGLRREEVAQRAHVSVTWYTWLEQGRGGAPSAEVLERIARALMLTEVEREHLFLLALGRPPETRYHSVDSITPRLQRVLDVLETSPAMVRTATWDVVAWNRAAAAVLGDYGRMLPAQRNILRLMFSSARVRSAQTDWESVARFVVAAFRAETARAGATETAIALVDELSRSSPEFERMWKDNEVSSPGGGTKQLRHPEVGLITMEYSSFAVDGRTDLTLVIYNPASEDDVAKVRALLSKS